MNKATLTRLAGIVQKDPVMLAKVNTLADGIAADLRKRNTPSRRIIEALTHEQLAEKAQTTPTTLGRFLTKHGIAGDVLVGNRLAYSKQLTGKICDAVFFSKLAMTAAHCSHKLRETQPDEAAKGNALADEYRAELARVLATIPKFKI